MNHTNRKFKVRLNEAIKSPVVRVISPTGEQLGEMSNQDAQQKAREFNLDLVEVAPNARPSVVKIMDYNKYIFKKKKKTKVKKSLLKQICFRPVTEKEDYRVKINKIIKLLEQNCKVKIVVRFRGREIRFQELGNDLIQRIKDDILDYAVVEQKPKFEGRQIMMVFAPNKTTNKLKK